MNATFNGAISAQAGDLMGVLCGWGLSGTHVRTEIDFLLQKHGLLYHEDDNPTGIELPNIGDLNAYKRSSKVAAILTSKADKKKYNIVTIEETTDRITHAIIEKEIVDISDPSAMLNDPNLITVKDAKFRTVIKFGFDKKAYYEGTKSSADLLKLECPDHEFSKRVKAVYEALCVVYTTDDIRAGMQRAFAKWHGVSILRHGGMYWVPAMNTDKVEAWQAFMADIENHTQVYPLYNSEKLINQLQADTQASLEGQLSKVLDDLEKFGSSESTRTSTLEKRLETFDDLRSKAVLFENLLGHNMTELKNRVAVAQAALAETLNKKAQNKS